MSSVKTPTKPAVSKETTYEAVGAERLREIMTDLVNRVRGGGATVARRPVPVRAKEFR